MNNALYMGKTELPRELQQRKQQMMAEMQNRHEGNNGVEVVRDLRAEVERLRADVKELQQLEKRRRL